MNFKNNLPKNLVERIKTPLYRNALYLILNAAITYLFGFLFWIVVARFYSETEVGFSSAIISAISLLSLLSLVGTNFSVIRFLPGTARPRELINSISTLVALVTMVTAAIFVIGADLWSPALSFVKNNAIFYLTFLVAAVLLTLSQLLDSVFIAKRRAQFVLCRSAIFSLVRIPLLALLVIYFHTFGVIAAWGIALGIALIISYFLFLPKVITGYRPGLMLNLGYFRDIQRYSGHSYLASLIAQAPGMILPLMVINLLGTESNAYFYIAWMIAHSLSAVSYSISQSLFAEGSISWRYMREKIGSSLKFTYLLLIPVVLILVIAGKWILLAFGLSYAANAVYLLSLLGLASLPRGIIHIYISFLRVKNSLKEIIIIQTLTAITILALSLLIMPAHGIIAVGYVWLGVHLIVAVALAIKLVAHLKLLN